MANEDNRTHGRSCYEQRYAANPGNDNTPARPNTFGGEFGEDVFTVITHIGIFVHLVPPDADGREKLEPGAIESAPHRARLDGCGKH